MASPFRIFRKHQKRMKAVLAIMAILAFTILGVVLDILQGGPSAKVENPVVVTTEKYGDLHRFDIGRLQEQRRHLLNFLQGAVREAGGEEMLVRFKLLQLEQMFGSLSEEATVNFWLVVQRAKELNMVVSDVTINQFLRDQTDNRLTKEQFAALYRQFGMPENFVFNAIHDELLAMNMVGMFGASVMPSTPAQRWDYFQRLNRKVDLEVAPLGVAQFVDAKEDPGDPVLEEFFNKYKDRFASPVSPDPGFRVPKTVAIEYVKAEINRFADPASVTEEEIKAYYEKNREQFRKVTLPEMDLGEPPAAAEPPATPAAPNDKHDAAQPPSPADSPAPTELPAPKTDEPPAPKADELPSPPAGKEGSQSAVRSRFHLVSTTQQAEEKDEAKPEVDPAPAADEKQPSPEPAAPATPEPKAAEPAAQPSEPAKDPAAAKDAAPPAPVYKSLDEARDEIRNILSRSKVRDRILQGFQPLRANMNKHHRAVIAHKASRDEDAEEDDSTAPTFNLATLTDPPSGAVWVKKGWKLVDAEAAKTHQPDELVRAERFGPPRKTELLTDAELAKLDIASSTTEGEQVFLHEAFRSMAPFLPGVSWDADGNGYLYWKTTDVEARVPKFDEKGMRDKVLAAWRLVQARKTARRRAEQLAKEARDAGTSLADSLGKQSGITVSTTGPFTWMTTGTLPAMEYRNPPRLSSVDNVELAGDEFMRTAYGLGVGDVGVAMNHPQNIVYVMRLATTSPLEKVLMASFEVDDFGKYEAVARGDKYNMLKAWYDDLKRDAGYEEKRPLEQVDPRAARGDL